MKNERHQKVVDALWIISDDHLSLWENITNGLCPNDIGLENVFKDISCVSGQCEICWCKAMKQFKGEC